MRMALMGGEGEDLTRAAPVARNPVCDPGERSQERRGVPIGARGPSSGAVTLAVILSASQQRS
ncbi:hypothetical protein GGTG_11747 [Gaeumannomyces tritici R3-111a-1]|uniref:Uncharacterized protein n=1 Tax=Gaeumannomyces tritici (strain R3-111a-1) TaxID=644352 RepID=J3PE24_GAET3|nr:hypothetical protein GGTG_11747 [Gaeumannomyces tritici R3-111a-1]EJT70724.1 hypothetical protein GGTG_11747 [Gaeumannomyces tritici R3-111a-1]